MEIKRRGRDSNPGYPKGTTVFETVAFDHSATSPYQSRTVNLRRNARKRQSNKTRMIVKILLPSLPMSGDNQWLIRKKTPLFDMLLLADDQFSQRSHTRAHNLKNKERKENHKNRFVKATGQKEINITIN